MRNSDNKPPALKQFIARAQAQMTDSNKHAVNEEVKQLIAKANRDGTMYSTNWSVIQLRSLASGKRASTSTPDVKGASRPAKKARTIPPPRPVTPDKRTRTNIRTAYRRTVPELFDELDIDVQNWKQPPIVGTSTEVFKSYVPVQTDARPGTVRHPDVIRKAFEAILQHKDGNVPTDTLSQIKSILQDITLQGLRSESVAWVYGSYARLLMENPSQNMKAIKATLRVLEALVQKGRGVQAFPEFLAYRILLLLNERDYERMHSIVAEKIIPNKNLESLMKSPHMKCALAVREAVIRGNYFAFFALYKSAPGMCGHLMDLLVERERLKALVMISRTYKRISLRYLDDILACQGSTKTILCSYGFDVDDGREQVAASDDLEIDLAQPGTLVLEETFRTRYGRRDLEPTA
ncbi:hypothetical protein CYLTODRAFT_423563 [Cylindrobasidium torrendii FP15055 ss-10]|uniref:SAC3/GANP/THP3 conserved domain-containing protein n=1 Tax=Cylindrobasidium torrendii FP15055 ss-10 TaxID=1314674 RepID=A0A0D7B6V9_9AGAR|nr:hypothetical protein CYLTODRAFT_423563 [Cylindrobasidium torrendii FP15055 ss-10]